MIIKRLCKNFPHHQRLHQRQQTKVFHRCISKKSLGLVGLPNIGKSTIFNAFARKSTATVGNFPFCTIEPTSTIVEINDKRLKKLQEIEGSKKIIASGLEIVDIAGLVEGAAEGKGLGNEFLSTISQVSLILHVVRCFDTCDGDFVEHVRGAELDPLRDIQVINDELAIKDMSVLERLESRLRKKQGDSKEREMALRVIDLLGHGKSTREFRNTLTSKDDVATFDSLRLLSAKPQILILNVGDEDIGNGGNSLSKRVQEQYPDNSVVLCGKLEADVASMEMDGAEASDMLANFGVQQTSFDLLVDSAMQQLNLQTYYTVGPLEARSWLYPSGATAAQCAGLIHTDFEKNFVKAEVIAYDQFIEHQGESGAKKVGAMRFEGGKYIVQDGDVLHFLTRK